MNKRLWTGLVMCVMTLAIVTAKTKEPVNGVYMYGMATSLMDSVVYVTDIQYVAKAVLNAKTAFLEARTMYSEQLRKHLEQQGLSSHITCAVSFNVNKQKLEKAYQKTLARYNKKKGITLNVLVNNQFVFKAVEPLNNGEDNGEENK